MSSLQLDSLLKYSGVYDNFYPAFFVKETGRGGGLNYLFENVFDFDCISRTLGFLESHIEHDRRKLFVCGTSNYYFVLFCFDGVLSCRD